MIGKWLSLRREIQPQREADVARVCLHDKAPGPALWWAVISSSTLPLILSPGLWGNKSISLRLNMTSSSSLLFDFWFQYIILFYIAFSMHIICISEIYPF